MPAVYEIDLLYRLTLTWRELCWQHRCTVHIGTVTTCRKLKSAIAIGRNRGRWQNRLFTIAMTIPVSHTLRCQCTVRNTDCLSWHHVNRSSVFIGLTAHLLTVHQSIQCIRRYTLTMTSFVRSTEDKSFLSSYSTWAQLSIRSTSCMEQWQSTSSSSWSWQLAFV